MLFVTLHHSLNTTKIELAAADRDTTALLHDLGRIALLTDEFGNRPVIHRATGPNTRESRSVTVIDLSGRIMASSDAATIGTRSEPAADQETELDQLLPIGTGGYRLGWLHVHFSNDGLVQAYGHATRLGLTIAVAGMLVIALVGWWIGHLLTRKLARLAAVADSVSGGDLSLRAQLSGRDEVARVGRAFDGMVDRLERRLETIRLDRDRLILPTEAINEGFVLWDPQERLVRCNQRFRELLGSAGQSDTRSAPATKRSSTAPLRDAVADNGRDWRERMADMLQRHRRGGGLMEFEPARRALASGQQVAPAGRQRDRHLHRHHRGQDAGARPAGE